MVVHARSLIRCRALLVGVLLLLGCDTNSGGGSGGGSGSGSGSGNDSGQTAASGASAQAPAPAPVPAVPPAPAPVATEPGSRFDASGFPDHPGRALVLAHCTGCHSGMLVQQNRATREGWEEIIRWMQRKQGLWSLEPAVEEEILAYLSNVYGPAAHNEIGRRPPLSAALMPPGRIPR